MSVANKIYTSDERQVTTGSHKLVLLAGFEDTIDDSFTVAGGDPHAVGRAIRADDLVTSDTNDKCHRYTGWSSTIQDSLDFSATGVLDAVAYSDTGLIYYDDTPDDIFQMVGFTASVDSSFAAPGGSSSDIESAEWLFDESDLALADKGASKLHRMTGFTAVIEASGAAPGFEHGVTFDGTDTLVHNRNTAKIHKLTGIPPSDNATDDSVTITGIGSEKMGDIHFVVPSLRNTGGRPLLRGVLRGVLRGMI